MTDKERLVELVEAGHNHYYDEDFSCTVYEAIADHLIANGVVVQKQGEWGKVKAEHYFAEDFYAFICSECSNKEYANFNYYPNCRAKMLKEDK